MKMQSHSTTFPEPPKDCYPTGSLIPDKEEKLTEAEITFREEIYVAGLQFVEWMRVSIYMASYSLESF